MTNADADISTQQLLSRLILEDDAAFPIDEKQRFFYSAEQLDERKRRDHCAADTNDTIFIAYRRRIVLTRVGDA